MVLKPGPTSHAPALPDGRMSCRGMWPQPSGIQAHKTPACSVYSACWEERGLLPSHQIPFTQARLKSQLVPKPPRLTQGFGTLPLRKFVSGPKSQDWLQLWRRRQHTRDSKMEELRSCSQLPPFYERAQFRQRFCSPVMGNTCLLLTSNSRFNSIAEV